MPNAGDYGDCRMSVTRITRGGSATPKAKRAAQRRARRITRRRH